MSRPVARTTPRAARRRPLTEHARLASGAQARVLVAAALRDLRVVEGRLTRAANVDWVLEGALLAIRQVIEMLSVRAGDLTLRRATRVRSLAHWARETPITAGGDDQVLAPDVSALRFALRTGPDLELVDMEER
jgi:hypothetical protein